MSMLTGAEARSKLLKGVNLVADAVKGTLGPQARTVILQNFGWLPCHTQRRCDDCPCCH